MRTKAFPPPLRTSTAVLASCLLAVERELHPSHPFSNIPVTLLVGWLVASVLSDVAVDKNQRVTGWRWTGEKSPIRKKRQKHRS